MTRNVWAPEQIFYVPGVPAQQGSKNRWGQEDSPKTKPWRSHVTNTVREQMDQRGLDLTSGPVVVRCVFAFTRPKGHTKLDGNLSAAGRRAPFPMRPDVDKLLRAILDSLTDAGVYLDDRQVVHVNGARRWGFEPGATISVQHYIEGEG